MNEMKSKRLAEAGYQNTSVADFFGLSVEQSELIEIKLAFTDALKKQREATGLSQAELAGKIGSSQSRIAKMEAGDPHVSLDLMIRALLAAGITRRELADVISEQAASSVGTSMGRVSLNPKSNTNHYKFVTSHPQSKLGDNPSSKPVLGA